MRQYDSSYRNYEIRRLGRLVQIFRVEQFLKLRRGAQDRKIAIFNEAFPILKTFIHRLAEIEQGLILISLPWRRSALCSS